MLIAFEGLDRTGKSTQIMNLKAYLENTMGRKVVVMKFPDRTTPIGQQINSFLQKQVEYEKELIHLLFSINRWELNSKIRQLLMEGVDILLDRYAYSGIAYSHAQGLDFDWCVSPDKGLPKPDVVLYFKVKNMSELASREEFGQEIYEHEEFQKKVAEVYENKLMQNDWLIVNASQTIAEVAQEIHRLLTEIVVKFDGKEILNMDFK